MNKVRAINIKKILSLINVLCLMPFIMVLYTVLMIDLYHAEINESFRFSWFYFSIGAVVFSTILSYVLNQAHIKFSLVDLLVALTGVFTVLVSYFSLYEITSGLIVFILLIAFYFFLRFFLFQHKLNVYALIGFFILTGLIEAIWGLCQLLEILPMQTNSSVITGSFFSSMVYAGYLSIVLPVALYFVFNDYRSTKQKANKRMRLLYFRWAISLITVIFIFLVLPITQCYAAWTTAFLSAGLVLFLYLRKIKRRYKKFRITYSLQQKKILIVFIITGLAYMLSITLIHQLKKNYIANSLFIEHATPLASNLQLSNVPIEFFLSFQEDKPLYDTQEIRNQNYIANSLSYNIVMKYIHDNTELSVISIFLLIIITTAIYAGLKKKRIAAVGGVFSLSLFILIAHPFNLLPFGVVFVFLLALNVSQKHHITFYQDLQHCYLYDFHIRTILNKVIVFSLLFIFAFVTFFCLYSTFSVYSEQIPINWLRITHFV